MSGSEAMGRRALPWLASALRVVAAVLLLLDGSGRVFGWPAAGAAGWVVDDQLWFLAPRAAGMLELCGGVLLLAGLGTRGVAMFVGALMVYGLLPGHSPRPLWASPHASDGFMLLLTCVAAMGGGRASLDFVRADRRRRMARASQPR